MSNAGYGRFGAAVKLSDAEIDRQIATDLTGSIQLIRPAPPASGRTRRRTQQRLPIESRGTHHAT